jgi:hypothetical protein
LDSARDEQEGDADVESNDDFSEPIEEENEVVETEPEWDIPPPVTEIEEIELVDLD